MMYGRYPVLSLAANILLAALSNDEFKSLDIRPNMKAANTLSNNTRISLRTSCVSDIKPALPVNKLQRNKTHDSKPTENKTVPNIGVAQDKNKYPPTPIATPANSDLDTT